MRVAANKLEIALQVWTLSKVRESKDPSPIRCLKLLTKASMFYSVFPEPTGSIWRTLEKLIWIYIPWALHATVATIQIKKKQTSPNSLISQTPLTILPILYRPVSKPLQSMHLKNGKYIFTTFHPCPLYKVRTSTTAQARPTHEGAPSNAS